jgi:hypothetical protein
VARGSGKQQDLAREMETESGGPKSEPGTENEISVAKARRLERQSDQGIEVGEKRAPNTKACASGKILVWKSYGKSQSAETG